MATTLVATGIQFPDSTIQTTSAGAVTSVATSGGLTGGTITTTPGTIEPGTKPQPTNFDIESLLLPGALALGLYFILKK